MQFDLNTARPVLASTPAAVEALVGELPADWTEVNEGPGTWTVHEVVAHLIHGERADWIPRVRHLIEFGASRPFPPFDRTFGFAEARERPLGELTREFVRCRAASLEALTSLHLTNEDLAREGRHPEFGVVQLSQHLATWVVHDLTHLSQIARIMAVQYRQAVGPWSAYLRIVRPIT